MRWGGGCGGWRWSARAGDERELAATDGRLQSGLESSRCPSSRSGGARTPRRGPVRDPPLSLIVIDSADNFASRRRTKKKETTRNLGSTNRARDLSFTCRRARPKLASLPSPSLSLQNFLALRTPLSETANCAREPTRAALDTPPPACAAPSTPRSPSCFWLHTRPAKPSLSSRAQTEAPRSPARAATSRWRQHWAVEWQLARCWSLSRAFCWTEQDSTPPSLPRSPRRCRRWRTRARTRQSCSTWRSRSWPALRLRKRKHKRNSARSLRLWQARRRRSTASLLQSRRSSLSSRRRRLRARRRRAQARRPRAQARRHRPSRPARHTPQARARRTLPARSCAA